MPLDEDLTVFFNPDELADVATIRTRNRLFDVNGIHNEGAAETLEMESLDPDFECIYSDVSELVKGDKLTVNSINYEVIKVKKDRSGKLARVLIELI
ncbi:MAG: hypothetical protein COB04_17690 [Gammaproteobacteria bacterium]|nr:MAG: hypothetical protein COB04_17690 [Gammaproteobacteria bacterium]